MARNRKNVIVIPWDFSNESEIALMHGIQLAKEVNNYIMLARFVEKPGLFTSSSAKEKIIAEEKEKLKEAGKKINEQYGINPYIAVEFGLSKGVIKKLVKEAQANLVIIGKKYHLSEKNAIKTREFASKFNGIDIPFIVTQQKPAHNYYKEIVVPLDHDKKYKETLHWVVYLSKYYNCNINIIKPYISDEFKKKEMSNNIYFTKKMLDKKNIIYGIKTAKKNRVFDEEVVRFAEMIDSDLIVMMVKRYSHFVGEKNDDSDKIPIMVINRSSQLQKYGGFH